MKEQGLIRRSVMKNKRDDNARKVIAIVDGPPEISPENFAKLKNDKLKGCIIGDPTDNTILPDMISIEDITKTGQEILTEVQGVFESYLTKPTKMSEEE